MTSGLCGLCGPSLAVDGIVGACLFLHRIPTGLLRRPLGAGRLTSGLRGSWGPALAAGRAAGVCFPLRQVLAGLQGCPVGAGRLTGGLGVPWGPFLVAGGCGGAARLASVFVRIWGLTRLARALIALGLALAIEACAFRCVAVGAPALIGVALFNIVGGVLLV